MGGKLITVFSVAISSVVELGMVWPNDASTTAGDAASPGLGDGGEQNVGGCSVGLDMQRVFLVVSMAGGGGLRFSEGAMWEKE